MADRSASSKKSDKKARRAAKLQQKEEASPQATAAAASSQQVAVAAASSQQAVAEESVPATKSSRKLPDSLNEGASSSTQNSASLAGKEQVRPQDGSSETPSAKKQLTKAERRALQEAQRQAKLEKKISDKPKEAKPPAVIEKATPKSSKPADSEAKIRPSGSKSSKSSSQSKGGSAKFFSHLPPYRSQPPISNGYIHPCIAQIGLQYAKGIICGSNARAVALLCAFKKVVEDYETPNQKDLARDLQDKLKQYMAYLHRCRPVSVSMESVSKYITPLVLGCQTSESEAKEYLSAKIDRFYEERIRASDDQIAENCLGKLVEDDVIVTYGHSSLVLKVLVTAIRAHPSISVIIVDSRPKFEGKEMVRKLVKACPGVSCTYVLINSLSYIMPRATKVLLGAHAVLANGYVMSRLGTSQVALMARTYNVPLLVCCETYKFSHRMQTDSFVANELGDRDSLVNINGRPGPLASLDTNSSLHVLNLCYDVTPPNYVTGLITETGVIPCTSAPVVIRVKQQFDINLKT